MAGWLALFAAEAEIEIKAAPTFFFNHEKDAWKTNSRKNNNYC